MDAVRHSAQWDWLADLVGASAVGLAAGYAMIKAAPALGLASLVAPAVAGAAFIVGMLAMRSVKPPPRDHALPVMQLDPIETGELLLETTVEESLLLEHRWDADVLLLEDRLADPEPRSRVVQLFSPVSASGVPQSLDRTPRQGPDATKALHAALAELRRSLR